ncbi:MAG: Holliday junction resolvase [Methanospirillum sp.]|nr:Holliday junction resolvase [Methanospirillum sp.]
MESMSETIVILILISILVVLFICYLRLFSRVEKRAYQLHTTWRERDLTNMYRQLKTENDETVKREVSLQTREWERREKEHIRQDAITRSRKVIHGKVAEHLIPFFPSFPWNPSDARFLGSPIDFVVFDGLSEGDVREIILVEVKSGEGKRLSPRERSVAGCAERKKVSFRVIHPDDEERYV